MFWGKHSEKNKNMSKEKGSNQKGQIVPILLAVFMLVGGGLIVWQSDFFSAESDIIIENETVQLFDADVALTDTSGLEYYSAEEDTIEVDAITGSTFINNQILVTLNSVEDRVLLEAFIDTIGGEIVGEITLLADYQILLEQSYSLAELEGFVTILKAEDWVYYASTQYVIEIDTTYIPNDEFWQEAWDDEFPVGINWGMEAINATEAWEYQDEMQSTVNIGIFDNMFAAHDDLTYAEVPLGMDRVSQMLEEGTLEWNDHGTHVAGIACAGFDNEVGITGISTNNNLYGVSVNGLADYGYEDMQWYKMALAYLILNKDCSVINISLGCEALQIEASLGYPNALDTLENYSDTLEQFLKLVIEQGYDNFVICKASGNFSDKEVTIENEVFYTGDVDAKYDFMGAIDDELVSDYIIMVGAVENLVSIVATVGEEGTMEHGGYQEVSYSCGGERLDILAPGYEIYSTIQGDYGTMSGTSMAAPYVAGVAGLVFSINPDLTGAQVKAILCDSASREDLITDENCGMLDAAAAVRLALTTLIDETDVLDIEMLVEFLMTFPSETEVELYLEISGTEVEAALGGTIVRYEIKNDANYQIVSSYADMDYVDTDALVNDQLHAIVYIRYDDSDVVSEYTVYYKDGNQIIENRLNKGISVIREIPEEILESTSDSAEEYRAIYQAFIAAYSEEDFSVKQYQFADLDQDGIEEMLLTVDYNDGILIGNHYDVYMLVDESVVQVCHGQSLMATTEHEIYQFVTYENKVYLLKEYVGQAYDNTEEMYYLINYQSGNIDDYKEYTSNNLFTVYEEDVFYP